jgi:hypothetical protein
MATLALITNNKGQSNGLRFDGYINDGGLGLFLLNNVSTENVDKLFNKENHIYHNTFMKSDLVDYKDYYKNLYIENNILHELSKSDTLTLYDLTMVNEEYGLKTYKAEYKRKSPHKLSKWREVYTYEMMFHNYSFDKFELACEYEYHFDETKWNICILIRNQKMVDKLNSIQEFKPYFPSNVEFWKTKCEIPLEIFQKQFNTYELEREFFNL